MVDLQAQGTVPGAAARRRRRWPWWLLGSAVLLVVAGLGAAWWLTRPPAPVSVPDVVNSFRSSPGSGGALEGTPAPGVYVYATHGSERVSAGVAHDYPDRTTLTVKRAGCGLDLRWDALAGRWARWQVCPTAAGWRLVRYVDVHKFLYMQDVHDYACSGFPAVVCRTGSGVLTSTVRRLGTEQQRVDGVDVTTSHLRVDQVATGTSVSTGRVDVWVLATGLPVRLEITDHGSQEVLGATVTYDESAQLTLTSVTPTR